MGRKKNSHDFDLTTFGCQIKEIREKQGLSRQKFANEMGLNKRYIAKIENEGQSPSLQVFIQLARKLHISVDKLIFSSDDEPLFPDN